MQKDETYHESAISYNDALAEVAEEQAEKVEHPEVKKWCRSVAKQHRFHSKRHLSALTKLQKGIELKEEDDVPDVQYRDAATGKFVTEEYAEQNQSTTVGEQVDIPLEYEVASEDGKES